jgi:CheY-like chemotaxis protein
MDDILVVDDEDQMRRYMSTLLKNGGHTVWEAPSTTSSWRDTPGRIRFFLKPFGPSRFIDKVIAVLGIDNRIPAAGLRQPAALHA